MYKRQFIWNGMDDPVKSASSKPTLRPITDSASHARFSALIDLPTPPFPDATATTHCVPAKLSGIGGCLNPPGGAGVPGPGTAGRAV